MADFWKALEFCSTLEEKSESEIVREIALRSNKSNHKRSPSGNNESPSKQKDQPVFDSEYCLEVLCNSVFIKKKALDNFRSFLQVVFSVIQLQIISRKQNSRNLGQEIDDLRLLSGSKLQSTAKFHKV